MSETLPAACRIKRRAEFLHIQTHGQKIHSRHLLFCLMLRPYEARESRLGITITTKVHKRANRRNYVKRCLREAFRRLRLKLEEPVDLVVIARSSSIELGFAEIQQELIAGLCRARLLPKNFLQA